MKKKYLQLILMIGANQMKKIPVFYQATEQFLNVDLHSLEHFVSVYIQHQKSGVTKGK